MLKKFLVSAIKHGLKKVEAAAQKMDPRQLQKIEKVIKKAEKVTKSLAKDMGTVRRFEIELHDGTIIRGEAEGTLYYIPEIPKVLVREFVIQKITPVDEMEIIRAEEGGDEQDGNGE